MPGRRSLALLLVLVGLTLVAACTMPGTSAKQIVRPYPDGCEEFGFVARRCAAIVAIARDRLGLVEPAATVELLSEPPLVCPTDAAGQTVFCKRSGGGAAVIVRITLPGSPSQETGFYCGIGGEGSIACAATPTILLRSPIEGYHDVPCASEDSTGPTGCATPLPAIDGAATAAARPLELATIDIPLDHDGDYDVIIGTAGIPNGILGTAHFALAQPFLDTAILSEDGISLHLRPTNPADRPFDNYYQHGRYPGVEDADVFLKFRVVQHDTGAALTVRDVVVR